MAASSASNSLECSTPLKVYGFGACMIVGTPHSPEFSFFNLLVRQLESVRPVEAEVVSLKAFPIDRALKYLKRKILAHRPDYVILQFGTTDTSAPLRPHLRQLMGGKRKKPIWNDSSTPQGNPAPFVKLASQTDSLRWLVKGLIARLARVPPLTSRKIYRESIFAMVTEMKAEGATPIVLTPFRFGDSWSDHYSHQFSSDIEQLSLECGFMCLNTRKLFCHLPMRRVVLGDGFHLTELAHELIASALFRLLHKVEQTEKRDPPKHWVGL